MPEQDDLKPMDEVLEISPTLRGRLFEIFLLVVLSLFFLKVYKMIPPDGVWLHKALGLDWNILKKKVDSAYFMWPIRFLCLSSFLLGLYVYLQQKLTIYRLTHLFLQKKHGIFLRTTDSTDLVTIKDQTMTRNILEMMLGLSTLKITASDVTHPEMIIRGITNEDASKIQNFIQKYAFRTYTEYRIARDKEARNAKRKNRDGIVGDVVDDDME